MTTYAFETIDADDALNIKVGDYLTFARGPASHVSVVYSPAGLPLPARIEVTFDGRTVAFGPELAELSQRGAIEMADGSRLLIGDAERDVLVGGDGDDGLYGGGGDDTLIGLKGDDLLQGNAGNDSLNGGEGSNTIYGGQGDDVINVSSYGETAGSWAHGNQGNDEVFGGGGADTLHGGQGDDLLGGKAGDDLLFGDLGNDEIFAGDGDDVAFGGAGDDTIMSGDGNDLIFGGDGDDQLVAYGFGEKLLDGGAGSDTLVSASPDLTLLFGGEGRDVFEFVSHARPGEGPVDVIGDWNGADDSLRFAEVSIYSILPRQYSEFVADSFEAALAIANEHIAHAGASYVAAQVGSDVYVFADTNGLAADGADIAVLLVGRTLDDIGLTNFI